MDEKARVWFDVAYNYLQGFLPFCVLTGEIQREDLKRWTKGVLNDDQLGEVEQAIKQFYAKLPTEQAFMEEKQRIMPQLTMDLRKVFPYVSTAFSFGKIRGDIDIGMIANGVSASRVDQSIMKNIFLVKKYPIVDWDSLSYFLSDSPESFVTKIESSRKQTLNVDILTVEEQGYVRNTLKNVNLLWGNESHIRKIQSTYSI